MQAIHRFFNEQGFYWVATPLIAASDTEGSGGDVLCFNLDLENLLVMTKVIYFSQDFFAKSLF